MTNVTVQAASSILDQPCTRRFCTVASACIIRPGHDPYAVPCHSVTACRAFACSSIEAWWIATGLQNLLNTTGEETLHLALECLTAVIKADAAAAAALEPQLSPRLLALWSKHVHDPLLSIDAVEAIEALAGIPSILPTLQVINLGDDAEPKLR